MLITNKSKGRDLNLSRTKSSSVGKQGEWATKEGDMALGDLVVKRKGNTLLCVCACMHTCTHLHERENECKSEQT